MRGSNGAGRAGKLLRAKTQNFPCRRENHEWMTTVQARQITSEKFLLMKPLMKPHKVWGETFGYQKRYRLVCWYCKISPGCVGSEKFFSTVVSYEKYNFFSFTAFSQRKLLLFFFTSMADQAFAHLACVFQQISQTLQFHNSLRSSVLLPNF